MVEENLSPPYTFVCLTENTNGLNNNIQVMDLPNLQTSGWWYKLSMFNDLGISGTALFMDLDVVIYRNIDKFFEFSPGDFCIIRDFNRCNIPKIQKMNSSVFRLELNSLQHVYRNYVSATQVYNKRFRGDQEFIENQVKNFSYWPDSWALSYKWEMHNRHSVKFDGKLYKFTDRLNPLDTDETSIAVFHGTPNPHECTDPWVIQHWR